MNICKLTGALLIIACGLRLSISNSLRLRRRITVLRDFETFLRNIYIHIEFSREPLPDIIAADSSDFAAQLRRCLGSMSLSSGWDKAAERFQDIRDREWVRSVFRGFGSTGPEGELEKLSSQLKTCGELIENAKENLRNRGKSEAVLPISLSAILALVLL